MELQWASTPSPCRLAGPLKQSTNLAGIDKLVKTDGIENAKTDV
jgi:hypothetical protein